MSNEKKVLNQVLKFIHIFNFRPLLESLIVNFQEAVVPEQQFSVDEMMIPFKVI